MFKSSTELFNEDDATKGGNKKVETVAVAAATVQTKGRKKRRDPNEPLK